MTSNLPVGTVTFLFTDIQGSTKLWQQFPNAMPDALAHHHEILRAAIEADNGYVFQIIGDAFCAAFATASDALDAALAAQRNLRDFGWGETGAIRVRMALHTGAVELRAGDFTSGEYVSGITLSRAARLLSTGHGGQILLSSSTAELLRERLTQDASLRDLGAQRLRDFNRPEHIFQVQTPDLPNEFPPLKTLGAELSNLPRQATPFVGRERETHAVVGLLRNPDVQLVTLTGTGGAGKTRLSIQVGAELLDDFEDGVWFVELAAATTPDAVLSAIAKTLKLKESGTTSVAETLHTYLAQRQLLLVLDNFEQVVSAAPLLAEMINNAPRLKILVTSRELLRLRGEHTYPVPPLGLPELKRKQTTAVLAQYEAIALFVQHAQTVNPAFQLEEDNANAIAEICVMLDGLPLAIELAAARSRLLKPAAILQKLKHRLNLLVGGARDLPKRQQTIRGAIDWSYELLDAAEKKLLARLSVFVGGWTLDSAETVCGNDLQPDVLSGMESLLDKSLIHQADGQSSKTRFAMLETIREYALEKLTEHGEFDAMRAAHANFVLALAESACAAMSGPEEAGWFEQLDDELGNVRAAAEWTLSENRPQLVVTLGRTYQYWFQRSIFREPLQWMERLLSHADTLSPLEEGYVLKAAGNFANGLGNLPKMKKYYQAALDCFRQAKDSAEVSKMLNNLGNVAWQEKNYDLARQLYQECLSGIESDPWNSAMTLNNLGSLAIIRGDYHEALRCYTRSRAICISLGAESGVSYAEWFLGRLALAQRKLDQAQVHFQNYLDAEWIKANPLNARFTQSYFGYIKLLQGDSEGAYRILNESIQAALEFLEQNPDVDDSWIFLDGKARLKLSAGNFEGAAQLFGAAWMQREIHDWLLTDYERPDYEAHIAEIRAAMGEEAFNRAFEQGQEMNLRDAMVFALEGKT